MRLLLQRRRWALRVLYILIGVELTAVLPLLVVAPRTGGAALLLLPAMWTLYLLVDAALLMAWRWGILWAWRRGQINLGVLAQSVATLPILPRGSVEAVLRSLPVLLPMRDRDLDDEVRMAIAAFSDWRWQDETASTLLPSVLLAALSACAATLMLTATPPSAGVGAIVAILASVLVVMRFALPLERKRRFARMLAQMSPERRAAVAVVVRDLNWSDTFRTMRSRKI